MQSFPFRRTLKRLLEVEALIDFGQRLEDSPSKALIEGLKKQRKSLKHSLLSMFNQHFGSAFRTASHRTKLFFEVSRYADVYTSSVANFLRYPLSYCFYAKRSFFPHEVPYEQIVHTDEGVDPHSEQQTPAQAQHTGVAGTSKPLTESSNAKVFEGKSSDVGGDAATSSSSPSEGQMTTGNPLERRDASEQEKMEQLGQ